MPRYAPKPAPESFDPSRNPLTRGTIPVAHVRRVGARRYYCNYHAVLLGSYDSKPEACTFCGHGRHVLEL